MEELKVEEVWEAMDSITGAPPTISWDGERWGCQPGIKTRGPLGDGFVEGTGRTANEAIRDAWMDMTEDLAEGLYLVVGKRKFRYAGGLVGFVPYTPQKEKE